MKIIANSDKMNSLYIKNDDISRISISLNKFIYIFLEQYLKLNALFWRAVLVYDKRRQVAITPLSTKKFQNYPTSVI